jgi:glycosyltransferase involved in cell wall biosynthesis
MKKSPKLILKKDSKLEPVVTIVVPVYNQEHNIIEVLYNIINNIVLTAQIIVIDDSSSDGTLKTIRNWVMNSDAFKHSFEIYSFKKSVYETACDSFGISCAKSKYIIEIQADMIFTDFGFDKRLLEALTNRNDTFIISGKGTHTWKEASDDYVKSLGAPLAFSSSILIFTINQLRGYTGNFLRQILNSKNLNHSLNIYNEVNPEEVRILPDQSQFKLNGRAGILGSDIFTPHKFTDEQKRTIYYGETVMRGPIIIDREKYFEIGGLDTVRFFLGGDDHDLTLRGWKEKKYRSGYTPIEFYSPISSGTTRKSRNLKQILQLVWRLVKVKHIRKSSALYQYALNPMKPATPKREKTVY